MFEDELNDTTNIYDHFLDLPQVRQRLNPFIYEKTPRSVEWIDMSDTLVDQLSKINYIRVGKYEYKWMHRNKYTNLFIRVWW
jgi:hypothetical protein